VKILQKLTPEGIELPVLKFMTKVLVQSEDGSVMPKKYSLKELSPVLNVRRTKLSNETKQFFLSLDMPIIEAFGMSETNGGHAMSNTDQSICHQLLGMQTKIINVDDKGHGEIITGRIKELITAVGENIPPVLIENLVKNECLALSNTEMDDDKRKFSTTLETEMNGDGAPREKEKSFSVLRDSLQHRKTEKIFHKSPKLKNLHVCGDCGKKWLSNKDLEKHIGAKWHQLRYKTKI
jgi:hypothetical protein